jgi:hypothetical protein
VRRCEFCDSPVPADATFCPICKEEIAEETLERILPMLKRPDAPDVRHMGVTERLWGVIRRPSATYRDIGQRPDQAGPFVIIIINALIMMGIFFVITSKFTVTVQVNSTYYVDTSVLSTQVGPLFYITGFMSLLPNLLIGMLYLIIGSAFAHLAFKITGGVGKRSQTMSIVGYSMLPLIIFRLLAVLVLFWIMPLQDANNAANFVAIVDTVNASEFWVILDYMTVASFFWIGFLLIFGIREAHDTSTQWAFLVSLAVMIVLNWTFWQAH